MSALARYFVSQSKKVAGYDRVSTKLTDELMREGINIHFEDRTSFIPKDYKDPERTLVIYTPAIPESSRELDYFRKRGFRIIKRAAALGEVFNAGRGIGIAGTHGKTSVSTMLAEILYRTNIGCNAFLGGISKNFNTNVLIDPGSNIILAEADEYDYSFLTLFPEIGLITSMDSDHLDIYKTHANLIRAFESYISQIHEKGKLILKHELYPEVPEYLSVFTYALNNSKAHYYAKNIKQGPEGCRFSIVTPGNIIPEVTLGLFGETNIENAVAAVAVADQLGVIPEIIMSSLADFKGVKRRFDIQVQTDRTIYIDDYAHHPREIDSIISSVKKAFPDKKITGVFQPHLFSRTKDFAVDFGKSLSMLDELILLDIYPAREEPIPGVDSKLIFDQVELCEKILINKERLFRVLKERSPEILLTMGAGDIDQFIGPIKDWLLNKR